MSDVKWNYSDIVIEKEEKDFWYKIEDSLYDKEEEERIRRYEKKESKYTQLEFEFDYNLTEEQVAPI